MREEEREADGPDDGEDAAEGAGRWAGEGVGVVIHYYEGREWRRGSLLSFCGILPIFFSSFSQLLLKLLRDVCARKKKSVYEIVISFIGHIKLVQNQC